MVRVKLRIVPPLAFGLYLIAAEQKILTNKNAALGLQVARRLCKKAILGQILF